MAHRSIVSDMTIDHREHTLLTSRRTCANRSTIGISVAAAWFIIVLLIGPQGDLTASASRMLAIVGLPAGFEAPVYQSIFATLASPVLRWDMTSLPVLSTPGL